jgi:hypothetical protein
LFLRSWSNLGLAYDNAYFSLLSATFSHIFTFGSRRSFSTSSMHFHLEFPLLPHRTSHFQNIFRYSWLITSSWLRAVRVWVESLWCIKQRTVGIAND